MGIHQDGRCKWTSTHLQHNLDKNYNNSSLMRLETIVGRLMDGPRGATLRQTMIIISTS